MIYILYKIEPKGFDLVGEATAYINERAAVTAALKESGKQLVLTSNRLLIDERTGRVYYQIVKRDL